MALNWAYLGLTTEVFPDTTVVLVLVHLRLRSLEFANGSSRPRGYFPLAPFRNADRLGSPSLEHISFSPV
jgi:hypothetical protein